METNLNNAYYFAALVTGIMLIVVYFLFIKGRK